MKAHVKKMKRQDTDREEIVTNYLAGKVFVLI